MSDNEMLHETSGQRFMRLSEENEYKQEWLASKLGVTRVQISRYWHDRTPIPDDRAQIIADIFGVRKEYILCEDDFETEDDFYRGMSQNAVGDMKAALAYLETLGIHLEPLNELKLPLSSIYDNMEAAYTYLSYADLEKLLHEYDFTLSSVDFHKKYADQNPAIKMSAPFPDNAYLSDKNFSGESRSGSHYVFADDPGNPFHVDCIMGSFFKAYRDGEYVQNIGASDVQRFVKELNLYTRFSADHILLNGDESDIW